MTIQAVQNSENSYNFQTLQKKKKTPNNFSISDPKRNKIFTVPKLAKVQTYQVRPGSLTKAQRKEKFLKSNLSFDFDRN